MRPSHSLGMAAALTTAVALAACSSAAGGAMRSSPQPAAGDQGQAAAIAEAKADSARRPYTQADIDFMTGMIDHHAQAIIMARWAPSHDAGPELRVLAARIINAQRDEIVTMQRWLRDRRQPVPEPDTLEMGMTGMMMTNGSAHHHLMPGMLTEAQMKQLDQARGTEFDRLFLQFMIQHHQGAVSMVKELFGTYGAAQDELTFKLASDINVDQTTEIARMQKMLAANLFGDTADDQSAVERP